MSNKGRSPKIRPELIEDSNGINDITGDGENINDDDLYASEQDYESSPDQPVVRRKRVVRPPRPKSKINKKKSSDVVQSLLSLSTDGSNFNIQMHQRKIDQVQMKNIKAIERRLASCNHNLKSLSSEHLRLVNEYNRCKSPSSKLKRSITNMNDCERQKKQNKKLEDELKKANEKADKLEAELKLIKEKQHEESVSSICSIQ
jgi:hypothetical protein